MRAWTFAIIAGLFGWVISRRAAHWATIIGMLVCVAGSVLEHYREMLAFRRETAALRMGRTRFLDLPDPVLGFFAQRAAE